MIKHAWSVLCRTSVIDSDTNTLSINDVLERLTIQAQLSPQVDLEKTNDLAFPVSFEVTTFLSRDNDATDEHASIKLIQYSPDNILLSETSNAFTIPKGMKRMRIRMKNAALKVTKSGEYKFNVELTQGTKKAIVATIPLDIVLDLKEA